MKKTSLAIILCLSCLISFGFAANRTDKYQAIKEWWDYYNQLQEIYQKDDYQVRHNNAVSKCINNSQKSSYSSNKNWQRFPSCVFAYNWDLHELWPTCWSIESIKEFCQNPSNWMTDEEFKIYEYVTNEETSSTWAIIDNQCYQSMNWYYDEKEDKCLCEDWFHIENNICVKNEVVKNEVVEETIIKESNQTETVEEIKNNVNETEFKRAKQYLWDKTEIIDAIYEIYKIKDEKIQNRVKKLVEKFKISKDEYTRSFWIYLWFLIE